jgi:hypothetical protein
VARKQTICYECKHCHRQEPHPACLASPFPTKMDFVTGKSDDDLYQRCCDVNSFGRCRKFVPKGKRGDHRGRADDLLEMQALSIRQVVSSHGQHDARLHNATGRDGPDEVCKRKHGRAMPSFPTAPSVVA